MIILGLDPGKCNFGYGVLKVDSELKESYMRESYIEHPEILESGLLTRILLYTQGEELDRETLRMALSEIQELCVKYGVDYIVIERWMKRPGSAVPSWVERLNHVIGAIIYSSNVPIKTITASSWKRKVLAKYSIASTKTLFQGVVASEHAGDAVCMGIYFYETLKLLKEDSERPKRARRKKAS